jgi:hypothetical protein
MPLMWLAYVWLGLDAADVAGLVQCACAVCRCEFDSLCARARMAFLGREKLPLSRLLPPTQSQHGLLLACRPPPLPPTTYADFETHFIHDVFRRFLGQFTATRHLAAATDGGPDDSHTTATFAIALLHPPSGARVEVGAPDPGADQTPPTAEFVAVCTLCVPLALHDRHVPLSSITKQD